MDPIFATLRTIRRKMVLQLFLEQLVVCAFLAAALGLALGSYRLFCGQPPWTDRGPLVLALVGFLGAIVWTCRRLPSLPEVAACLDTRGATNDRFLTALRFSAGGESPLSALHTLAIQDCGRFATTVDFSAWKLSLPWRTKYLAVPAVAAWLLSFSPPPHIDSPVDSAQAQAEATRRAQEMENLAAQLLSTPGASAVTELEAIAAQLKASAVRVQQAGAEPGADPNKTALGELSSIEAMLKKMAKEASQPSAEELAALASALEQFEAARQAAAALREGDLGAAGRELAALNRELQEAAGGEKMRKELAQAIRSGLERAARGQRGALAQQVAPGASPALGGESDAIKRLAELLQKLGGSPSSQPSSGSTMDAQTMQKVLAALQNLKHSRDGGPTNKTAPSGSPTPSPVIMESFANAARADQSTAMQYGSPSGSPGSDRDATSTETPFGAKKASETSTAAPAQITGVLGEGESLHDLLPAAGDPSRSSRRYQEIYDAMAPAAEAAGWQEDIPLGSRFYIKRYFQNIRPSP